MIKFFFLIAEISLQKHNWIAASPLFLWMLFACLGIKKAERDKHPLRAALWCVICCHCTAGSYQTSVVCERRQSIYVFLIEVCHKRHENCSCSRFAWQVSQGIGKQHFQLMGGNIPCLYWHLLRIRATVVRLACVKWIDKLHRPPGYLIGWILSNLDFFFFFSSAKGSFKLEDKDGVLSSHSVGSISGWTTFKLCDLD